NKVGGIALLVTGQGGITVTGCFSWNLRGRQADNETRIVAEVDSFYFQGTVVGTVFYPFSASSTL
ncbi:hypothetical protein CYMTET_24439, partial [Cymbomonas tetramitiformis]